jgi:hypothetical protein
MKTHYIPFKGYKNVARFYCIKAVDVDKISFDVYATDECKIHNNFNGNKVLVLTAPTGTVRLKADAELITYAVKNIGCVVYDFTIGLDGKKAVLINMHRAIELEVENNGGN